MIAVVLDTNVLLDLWVFEDDGVQPLREGLEQGRFEPLACTVTDAELVDVLARPQFGISPEQQHVLLSGWQAATRIVERIFPAPWRCTDPKDQPFLDLAFTARASLLVTRDKALLRLARKARKHGLKICRPADISAAD
jgi:predicted nucleic acid-binding protein